MQSKVFIIKPLPELLVKTGKTEAKICKIVAKS